MSGQRQQLDADGWREVSGRFDAAATTVDAFCAREGSSSSSLYRWRERLRRVGTSTMAPCARAKGNTAPASSGFIELGDLAHAARHCEAGVPVRLELGGGLVLQITSA